MKRAFLICLVQLTATFLFSQLNSAPQIKRNAKSASPIGASQTGPKAQAKILEQYGNLPLSFEANHGQTDARVKFLSRTPAYSLFLTSDEAVLTLTAKKTKKTAAKRGVSSPLETRLAVSADRMSSSVLRMKLRNAEPSAKIAGIDELPGTSNYFIGNDPAKWRTNVPTYAKVKYEGIYSGVDLVYYGNQRQLEYDFIVAPGADPRRIAFDVSGARQIRQDAHGDLVLKLQAGEIRWRKPVVYQEKDGARHKIAAHYSIAATNRVTFELAKYDASRPLYIDPLIYSTYLGGSDTSGNGGGNSGNSIAVDSSGNAYVTGLTGSTNFPVTPGSFQTACASCANGFYDAFVTKFNPTGSGLVYSTYLNGSDGRGYGNGIAVDSLGDAYIVGNTQATDFPTTPGAFQTTCGNCEYPTFVTEINPSGSALVYSTYLYGDGGAGPTPDYGAAIAVDSAGSAYVTGSTDAGAFPVTPGAYQTTRGENDTNAFVTKFNPSGSALVYSTYLSGLGLWAGLDGGAAIAIDSAGDAYVTGYTQATVFPTTVGAFQTSCVPNRNRKLRICHNPNAFVTEFDPSGSSLVYSTYLGGSNITQGLGIAVDSGGDAYVTGYTYSSDFPTTPGAFQTVCNGGKGCKGYGDAFVTEFNPTGSALIYSTFLGGGKSDSAFAIVLDSAGNVYVTGVTYSPNFPTANPIQLKEAGKSTGNAFVSKLNAAGSGLVYSTYLGGSGGAQGNGVAIDSATNAYVVGWAGSNFPVTPGAFQTACASCPDGWFDAFVAKLNIAAATATTLSSSPNPSTYGEAVTFSATVTSALGAPPDGEAVSFMKAKTVLGTGSLSGGTATFVTSTLPVGTISIKAVYAGDSNFGASTSKAVKQVVQE
ncbi:MAG: SBBP repeat-containing protein [Terriglobales bacterium]